MEGFLIKYGLWAIFLASMFEGDIVVPTAGAMAAFGYFHPVTAGLVCIAGIFAGDCFWYWAGRLFGERLEGTKFYKRAKPKAEKFAEKFGLKQIVLARFVWGVRIASMALWGFKRLNFATFAAIDLAASALFGAALTALGYFFSYSLRRLVTDFKWIEFVLGLAFIAAVVIFFVVRRRKKSKVQSPKSKVGKKKS
jgi:membrane protein DedA with SNARE-associated domain